MYILPPFRNINCLRRETFHTCPQLLEDLREMADRAHRGTSFSSEVRAADFVDSYSEELAADLATMRQAYGEAAPEVAEYEQKYRSHARAWLSARSGCISTMIAGGSKFPVRRAEKANRSEQLRYEEWQKFRATAAKRAARAGQEPVTPASELEAAQRKLATAEQFQELMKAGNRILKKAKGQPCTAELLAAGFTEKSAAAVQVPGVFGRVGFESFSLSNNLAEIKRLRQRVGDLQAKAAAATTSDAAGPFSFAGGRIELDFTADRLQIIYDEKPDDATRAALKKRGFRWAPSVPAWQRKLTEQAKSDAAELTGATFGDAPQLRAIKPQTYTTAEVTNTTENGFTIAQRRLVLPMEVAKKAGQIVRLVKAAEVPAGTSWKAWQPLAEAVDALAGELKGPLLTSCDGGKIGLTYCADWSDPGQLLLEISATEPATEPAPVDAEPKPFAAKTDAEKVAEMVEFLQAGLRQEVAALAASGWPAKFGAQPVAPALSPEQWAQAELAERAKVDAQRLQLLANYHGPATLEQLATLEDLHPVAYAHRHPGHAAQAPAPAAPTEQPAELPQVGDVAEYHIAGRELANGWKIPTIQPILEVSPAGAVLTEKDGWLQPGAYQWRPMGANTSRAQGPKCWTMYAAGHAWPMHGKAPAKTPEELSKATQARAAHRCRTEAARVEKRNAEQLQKLQKAGPLVALLFPPEPAQVRYSTPAQALDDTRRRRQDCAENLRGMKARWIREARRRLAALPADEVAAYAQFWAGRWGGLDPCNLCNLLSAPGAAAQRQQALAQYAPTRLARAA